MGGLNGWRPPERLARLAESAVGKVSIVDGRVSFSSGSAELLERLRDVVVEELIGEELGRAEEWVSIFLEEMYRAISILGLKGVLLPRELRSFTAEPRRHLAKKLYQYSIDLGRGKLAPGEFLAKARSALSTSLSTNLRSIYQNWAFLSLVSRLAAEGAIVVYPEHGYLHIERQGRQRGGSIPANLVLRMPGAREASFYLEAPRPIGWGDSRDLERAWSLYTSLRPDMIVYRGRVVDMVDWSSGAPRVRRPNAIVEYKELPDWYERVRYLKGPLVERFTAEEWYSRWFEGLRHGLADILGYEARQGQPGRRGGVKVREHRLVLLYKEVYRPDALILVSRSRLPSGVRRELENEGVVVLDGVEMGCTYCISQLADELETCFRPVEDGWIDRVERMLWDMGVEVSRQDLEKALAMLAEAHIDELVGIISRHRSVRGVGGPGLANAGGQELSRA